MEEAVEKVSEHETEFARFAGVAALIAGGASGIGLAAARRLLDEGAEVVIADVDAAAREQAVEDSEGRLHAVPLDVTDIESWRGAVVEAQRLAGPVSALVNAAGVLRRGAIDEIGPADWRFVVDVNLTGAWLGCREIAPAMRAAGRGVIVNIASVAATRGVGEICAYAASKGGVRELSRALAAGFARNGDPIRVCAVSPGVVDTPMVRDFFEGDPEGMARWLRGQKLRRLCADDEAAGLIALLLSGGAEAAIGGEYFIDGGATA